MAAPEIPGAARPPQRIHLDLPDVRLSALDYGEPFAGAVPLLTLHGQADMAWSMHPVATQLSATYRVVSLDLRGHGDSDHRGAYSILHFISDVIGAVELLDLDRPVVLGHSLGGQIAAQCCGLYPDLARALVVAEGIGPPVRLSGGGAAQRMARAREWVTLARQPLRLRPMADRDEAATRLLAAHPGLDAERAAELAEHGTKVGPDGGVVWKFDPYSRHWLLSHDHDIAEERWAAVPCPVLVVTGALAWERWWKHQSPAAKLEGWNGFDPDETARRVACFADVEHREVADAGHMLPYDCPAELAVLVGEFLDRRLDQPA